MKLGIQGCQSNQSLQERVVHHQRDVKRTDLFNFSILEVVKYSQEDIEFGIRGGGEAFPLCHNSHAPFEHYPIFIHIFLHIRQRVYQQHLRDLLARY